MSGYGDMPFGLKEVKIVPSSGSAVSLPAAQRLTFRERIASAELKGNDVVKGAVSYPEAAEWSLENGGISLEAYAALTGRTATAEGTTPNQTTTLVGKASDRFPYIKLYGKALGAGADDIHCKLYKAKLTAIEGTFEGGGFLVTACTGIAIDDGTNGIFEFVQNETAAELAAT